MPHRVLRKTTLVWEFMGTHMVYVHGDESPWSNRFEILTFRDIGSRSGGFMDAAQQCRDQSAECRRLVKLAQSEAEAHALKNLARTWAGLAGQIDRYNALMREQRRLVRK
jgi:hypothetical protein